MSKIYSSAAQLVGKTPLLEVCNIEKDLHLKANILVKLELFNPAGSVKDRVAKCILDDAESKGLLTKDTVVIEPTSGNTGIGLASVCAARGYRVILVMPDTMSVERRKLIKAYGAEVVLSDGKLGMRGAIEKAEELKNSFNSAIVAGQFVNEANPLAHYLTTAPEIFEDTDGKIDALVAGVGTGGTISGCGKYLKERLPNLKVFAVEPFSSPVLSGGKADAHGLQGIGAGFVPKVLDTTVYDKVIKVTEEQAYAAARLMGKKEGVLVGITSGAALHVAIELAKTEEWCGKRIVAILPDGGDRYLSTPLYE